MGLEAVELILAIEDEFALRFPDASLEKVVTVDDLFRLIVLALDQRGETFEESQAWKRMKQLFVEQLGVRPEQVVPPAEIVKDLGAD